MEIFTRYHLPPRRAIINNEPSMTQQHFADECDINNIMKRYQNTGILTEPGQGSGLPPMFGDFSEVSDYQTAQNAVIDVQEAFAQLPSRVRARFDNDPAALLEFLGKEENRIEAVSLGLVNPPSVDLDGGDNTKTS